MKPLNLDNSPCSPISSNCVIWQGPSIPCIKLCTGDTITDVVYALAIKLCNIVDAVNISTLDLSCLDITTGTPSNINDLLQILIDKICTLNNVPTPSVFPTPGNTSCPTNCIVPVAECLQTNGQTTMKLLDYVQLIGNTICDILDDITIINSSITNLTIRVTALESIPPTPPYILPSVVPDCTLADGSVIGGISYPLNIILTALVNDDNHGYCALLSQLGQPNEINVAYNSQSVDGTEGSLSNCALTLDQLFSVTWISAPTNLSESFIDLWLVVQDIRDAYKRYNVTAGNSNVTVTTTTTPDSCGPEVSFAITAKSSSVLPGDNITSVTTNVVGYDTEYTVNAKNTTVAAGDNVTVETNTTDPANTIYTVTSKYGCEMFNCQLIMKSSTYGSWMLMPSQLANAAIEFAFPPSLKTITNYNNITTTSSIDNLTYNISKTSPGWYVSQAQFDLFGCSFGTFDVLTGVFNITKPGVYLLTAFLHLKPNSTGTAIWTINPGSFGIGLCANGTDLYFGQTQTFLPNVTRQVDVTGSRLIVKAGTTPTPIFMNVLNYSDRDYDPSTYNGSDSLAFSIVRLKDELTLIPGI